ncbi:MAG TPA: cation:proton antiporter, partial [Elainellaceae cyanobacterium]
SQPSDSSLRSSIPIREIRGNFVNAVSRQLEPRDLLLITASTHRIGEPVVGREPEAIARRRPNNSMIIVHYPRLTE